MISLSLNLKSIQLAKKAEIVLLLIKNMKILIKYLDFLEVFSKKKALVLPKMIKLNQYIVKLEKDKQLFSKLIYSLSLIKLKMFKIYIKINLANGFI